MFGMRPKRPILPKAPAKHKFPARATGSTTAQQFEAFDPILSTRSEDASPQCDSPPQDSGGSSCDSSSSGGDW